jgi:hypothetical protein
VLRLLRSFVAGLLVAVLAQAPVLKAAPPASVPALGVITQALHANVGDSAAMTGSTIFEGDVLQTDKDGSLRVRVGASQAYLFNQASVVLHPSANGFSANLTRGGVILSSNSGQTFHLLADGATIEPGTVQPTVAQVTWVSPKELVVSSQKGSLQVSMGNQTETIADGTSYRMVIAPPAASAPAASSPSSPASPQATLAGSNFTLYLLIGLAVILTTVGIILALESPCLPSGPTT